MREVRVCRFNVAAECVGQTVPWMLPGGRERANKSIARWTSSSRKFLAVWGNLATTATAPVAFGSLSDAWLNGLMAGSVGSPFSVLRFVELVVIN